MAKGIKINKSKRLQAKEKKIKIFAAAGLFVIAAVIMVLLLTCDKPEEYRSLYDLPDYVTEDYITVNQYSRPKIPLEKVNAIVIHYIGNPGTSAAANRNYFDGLSKQSGEGATYASSNFIVGLEGEIIACVPINEIAYASNNRNSDTISIETCHPDETGKFNAVTYDSLVELTAWLCNHFGLESDNVIRHYDVTGKLCPLYFVEHEDAWETFKSDVQTRLERLREEAVTTTAAE
ncbi:MAG: N-acetylmuramoyl-L-alanine amidase [Lachnospiraceae bacterium]|nr:N-acetylmuramoyl-L-alanine amidase [Lachnospiraceae bacterium]